MLVFWVLSKIAAGGLALNVGRCRGVDAAPTSSMEERGCVGF